MSNFSRVSEMNAAFGNPKGDPANIDWKRVRAQCRNIGHEFCELLAALGALPGTLEALRAEIDASDLFGEMPTVNVEQVRDSLCDIHVFAYGAHHLMGIHADLDMDAVVAGVMTRFVKDDADKAATIEKHAAKGVTEVYFEGEYPKMIMKSAVDQPDAPKGKFLKSASYSEPVFYTPFGAREIGRERVDHGAKITELGGLQPPPPPTRATHGG